MYNIVYSAAVINTILYQCINENQQR